MIDLRILGLGIVDGQQGLHDGQFVAPDQARAHFVQAGDRVEVPALRGLDQWDGQRPSIRADGNARVLVIDGLHRVGRAPGGQKPGTDVGTGGGISF